MKIWHFKAFRVRLGWSLWILKFIKMHIFGLAFILNFSLKWQFSFFGPNSTGKGIFDLKKTEHSYWILHIRIRLGTKFQFKQIILIFGPGWPKKSISSLEQKNWTPSLNFAYQNFSLNWQFFSLFTLPLMIQLSGKTAHLIQKSKL